MGINKNNNKQTKKMANCVKLPKKQDKILPTETNKEIETINDISEDIKSVQEEKILPSEIIKEEIITSEFSKDTKNLEAKTNDTSFTFSDRSVYTGECYFEKCKEEDYEITFLELKNEDKEKELERKNQRVDVVMNNFKPWENIDKTKVEEKDISGHGGSKTYLLFIDDESVEEIYRKLIFHQRRLDPKDP